MVSTMAKLTVIYFINKVDSVPGIKCWMAKLTVIYFINKATINKVVLGGFKYGQVNCNLLYK